MSTKSVKSVKESGAASQEAAKTVPPPEEKMATNDALEATPAVGQNEAKTPTKGPATGEVPFCHEQLKMTRQKFSTWCKRCRAYNKPGCSHFFNCSRGSNGGVCGASEKWRRRVNVDDHHCDIASGHGLRTISTVAEFEYYFNNHPGK